MTLSIVGRCKRTGQLGVAAVTCLPSVGNLVPHTRARAGAVASQGLCNPYLGIDALRLLAEGRCAQEALAEVLAADPGRDLRQVGVVDASGRAAAWTGEHTTACAGHVTGEGLAVQGNRLVDLEPIEAAADAFGKRDDLELAERLLGALEASRANVADREGIHSATVEVVGDEEYPLWDLRVDFASDPLPALRQLYERYAAELAPQIARMSTRDDPLGDLARAELSRQRG